MPYMSIYYTNNFQNEERLFPAIKALHVELAEILGTAVDNFKCFFFPVNTFVLGQDSSLSQGYMRIELKMLAGRTEHQREQAEALIFNTLSAELNELALADTFELAVNIFDITGRYHSKSIKPSSLSAQR